MLSLKDLRWLVAQVGPIELAARLRLKVLKTLARRWRPPVPESIAPRTVFRTALDAERLRAAAPGELVEQTAREAELIMQGTFTLFAGVPFEAPAGIPDWRPGAPSGPRRGGGFSFDIDIAPGDDRDIRFTWELSRHGDLAALARAAFLSGEDRLGRRLKSLLADWMDSNPFLTGPNWISPLEVAMRAISWTFIDDFAPIRDGILRRRFLEMLFRHGACLERFNSAGLNPSNHIIGEAAGLFVLGLKFRGHDGAGHWRARGARILEDEIRRQTYPSGASREHSVGYHRFVTGLFSLCLAVGGEGAFSESFRSRLAAMYRFLETIARPDGSFADFGDNDNAVALRLGPPAPNDLTRDLQLGRALFGDEPAVDAERKTRGAAFWLLGSGTEAEGERVEGASGSSLVKGIDLAVLRSADGRLQVEFDCGPQGYSPVSSHGHADALSVTVWRDGARLVDPGTYRYNGAPDWRDAFRSSLFHNTLVVDGTSQARPASPFRWYTLANARPEGIFVSEDFDWAAGILGPSRGRPWRHVREVIRLRSDVVIVIDRVRCPGAHRAVAHFHLGDAEVTFEGAGASAKWADGGAMRLVAPPGVPLTTVQSSDLSPAWRSPSYGMKQPSAVVSGSADFRNEACLWWLLCFDGAAPPETAPLERGDGQAVTVTSGERTTTFINLPKRDLAHAGEVRFAGRWLLIESERGEVSKAWAADAWGLDVGGKRLFARFGGERVALIYDGTSAE
ncbi:MAG: heparinase II/III family protein [Planctomycetota bacterium]|jgi:hypothetical protein